MRIGLNATCFNDRPSGARQRFLGLYRPLIGSRPDDRFIIYQPRDCDFSSHFAYPNVEFRTTPMGSEGRLQRWARGLLYWPRQLRDDHIDHLEQFHLPTLRPAEISVQTTVHDLRFMTGDGVNGAIGRLVGNTLIRPGDRILTVSQTMRQEILARFPQTRCAVVYNGIDLPEWQMARSPGQSPPRLLAVGHLEARKNYGRLLKAIAIVRGRGTDIGLTIVGRDSGEGARLTQMIADLQLSSAVDILGDVDDRSLHQFYQTATLFIYPSTYEGFGIPLLEAMASGIPILASDLPVFREIVGQYASYFDPNNVDQMAHRIEQALADPANANKRSRDARTSASRFDYEVLAGQLSDLIVRKPSQI